MDQPDQAPAGAGCCDAFARLQKMAAEAGEARGRAAGAAPESDSAPGAAATPSDISA
ncbi:hypothetical protein [Streptomyces sp. NPDC021020]|uniref:hypothetical protein n=1 Tax=Streptomyces sp. NPDC021020 TaxID=3365109 RepID=UPI0037A3AA4D